MKRALVLLLAIPFVALAQTSQPTKPQQPSKATAEKKLPDKKTSARKASIEKPEPVWLTPQQALARYQEAITAEKDGHHRHAFVAYLEAAENGHGQSQKKIGDIYSMGGPVVKRDYQVALRWYEKARAQGVPIPKPQAFTRGH